MIRTMREIAAALRLAAEQTSDVAARLRTHPNPEARALLPDVQTIAGVLSLHAMRADRIGDLEGEAPVPMSPEHDGLTQATHPDGEVECIYGCLDPIVCDGLTACAHCVAARAVALTDLVGIADASIREAVG